jgi:hypothetical protein
VRRVAALLVCVASVAAGCGGDDGGSEEGTRTVTETVVETAPANPDVTVPSVVGRPLEQARRTLADAGLVMQTRRKTSNRPAGEVLRQDPSAGVRAEKGATVRLVIAEARPAPKAVACGDLVESGAGTYDVRATGLDCETAIVIARQWEQECATQPDGSCEVTLGFDCTYRQVAHELGEIACVSGDRRVEFQTGA